MKHGQDHGQLTTFLEVWSAAKTSVVVTQTLFSVLKRLTPLDVLF